MHRSDDPAPGDYDDYYIVSTLRSESSTFRLDQTIPFTTRDPPEHDALQKQMSRTHQIDPAPQQLPKVQHNDPIPVELQPLPQRAY